MKYFVCYESAGHHGGVIEEYDDYSKAKEHFLRLKDSPRNTDDISVYIEETTDDEQFVDMLIEHDYPHPA